jgi:hypothetical protein
MLFLMLNNYTLYKRKKKLIYYALFKTNTELKK